MASTPLDTIIAANIDGRGPKTWQQIREEQPTFAWMKEKGAIRVWEDGGQYIETNIETRPNDTFGASDYKQKQDLKEQNPLQTVKVGRKFIDGNVTWYDADEEANQGKGKVTDYVDSLMTSAESSAKSAFALELWQDGTGVHMDGIPAIMSGNTYQGIDRTAVDGSGYYTNGWWKTKSGAQFSYYVPYGGTNVLRTYGPYNTTMDIAIDGAESINTLYDDCSDNGGTDGPDFALTGQALFGKLCAIARSKGMDVRNQRMVELGFPENLQFRGASIVWDRNCGAVAGTPDATTFVFLNFKYVWLRPYLGYEDTFKPTPVTPLYGDGVFGKTRLMRWCGNLQSNKPQRLGMLTNKS